MLAGGKSTRMQRDKAALAYDGEPQLARAVSLLSHHVDSVHVSVRASQKQDRLRSRYSMIADSIDGTGPIVGILSALEAHAHCAWLVLACDLPFLSDAVLRELAERRQPEHAATAYRSARDGLPEPLCAIWEPRSQQSLASFHANGGTCPRKFLIREGVPLLELRDAQALDNVNTPEEYAAARM